MTYEVPASHEAPLRVNSGNDLISLVPYLLGHHPAESLVLVGCDRTRVIVTVRLDLNAPLEAWAQIVPEIAGNGVATAHLIGYGPAAAVHAAVDDAQAVLSLADIDVPPVFRVEHDRVYPLGVTPSDSDKGTPLNSHTAVAAQAIVSGMVALPDRTALAELVAPTGPDEQAAMQAAVDRVRMRADSEWRSGTTADHATGAVSAALDTYRAGARLSDEDLAHLTVLLSDVRARDAVLSRSDGSAESLTLWTDVTRRALTSLVADPACLLAVAAWLARRSPLAWVALDRALGAAPTHRFTQLLSTAIRAGMSPEELAGALHCELPAADRG